MSPRIRILTYNIRHGQGVDELISLGRIYRTIKNINPDLIALQEVDRRRPRSMFVHQSRLLARWLRYYYAFGPNVKGRLLMQYGNAILSRPKIYTSINHALPHRGEKRGVLEGRIPVGRFEIGLYCTHLGLSGSERLEQIDGINSILDENPGPFILAGDFNAGPLSREITILGSRPEGPAWPVENEIKTFPSYRPQFKLDYIFASRHWQVLSAFTHQGRASDHLPLVADLLLTPPA